MHGKCFGTVRVRIKILVALIVNNLKQGHRNQAGGKRMDVKTHPAKSSPTVLLQFVGLEVLAIGKCGHQGTHKSHQGSQVTKIAHKGIYHTILLGIEFTIRCPQLERLFLGTWKDTS